MSINVENNFISLLKQSFFPKEQESVGNKKNESSTLSKWSSFFGGIQPQAFPNSDKRLNSSRGSFGITSQTVTEASARMTAIINQGQTPALSGELIDNRVKLFLLAQEKNN
jgi:hypothetical protein